MPEVDNPKDRFFQIENNQIFLSYAAPFYGLDLAKVPYDIFEGLSMMWEDIDYASEVAFPRALQRACSEGEGGEGEGEDGVEGEEGREAALAVGKTKNEVLLQTVSEIRLPG